MTYLTHCSHCEHRQICKIREKFTACIDWCVEVTGQEEACNKCEVIFTCPYTTSAVHQEALLAYKKVFQ